MLDGGLTAWEDATGLPLPRPPGGPSDWTCLLEVAGPYRALALAPDGAPVLDAPTLGAWLQILGRPVHPAASRALLLVTPIPRLPDPEGVALQLMGHPVEAVRAGAARLLGAGEHPLVGAGLLRLLRGPSATERGAALRGLAEVGGASSVAAVVEGEDLLGDRLHAVAGLARRHGWAALQGGAGSLGGWVQAIVEDDVEAIDAGLRSAEAGLRQGLAACVAARPELAVRCVASLTAAMEAHPELDGGHGLMRALGAGGEEAVEPLAQLLEHDRWEVRAASAVALGHSGPAAAQVDTALRKALGDDHPDVQREAALARQLAGRDVAGMTTRLTRRVARTHRFVERVKEAGGTLGSFDAVLYGHDPTPELLARLASPHDPDVAAVAALWLGCRGGTWAAAVLDGMAADRHQRVTLPLRRGAAGGRLAAGGAPVEGGVVARLLLAHRPALPGGGLDGSALEPHAGELAALALGDPDAIVRWSAVQALRRLGRAADPFLPVLDRVAATDPSSEVRLEAFHARPAPFGPRVVADRLARVLHPEPGAFGAGGPALLALARDEPELAFALAQGLLDHDLRPLALAAARVVGQVAATDPDRSVRWTHEGVRRLGRPEWQLREVGATVLGALGGGVSESLREEAIEVLQVRSTADPDDDVRAAASRALAAWRDA